MPAPRLPAMETLSLHVYPSPIKHESRMLKETKSAIDAGFADRVVLVGMWAPGLPENEPVDNRREIWRVRPVIGSQAAMLPVKALRYVEWMARIFLRFRTARITYLNCHSLPVLPLAPLFKLFQRATIVYDTHELETEVIGAGPVKRFLFKIAERLLIRSVDLVLTVNESIAGWYRREYGLTNVTAVRNIPSRAAQDDNRTGVGLRQRFHLREDDILFLYQGMLSEGRSIPMLLDVFQQVDIRKHIVFMGFGEHEAAIKGREDTSPNIHFHEAVGPQELGAYTRDADVGVCLIENVSLSFYLSLPNKLFEYVVNGVPAVVSDFPEMARVVDEGGCGWKVPVDRAALLALVSGLTREEIARKRAGALEYRKTLGWQHEEKAMIEAYRAHSSGGCV